jgi:hypothetical protein
LSRRKNTDFLGDDTTGKNRLAGQLWLLTGICRFVPPFPANTSDLLQGHL